MAEFPALPLWTDAWVADTHHLTHAQRGAFMDLLILMWRTPGCSVPDDDAWIMAHLPMLEADFYRDLKPLINDLCQRNATGRICQKRLTREFAYVTAHREKQRVRANKRWANEKARCQGNATSGNAPTPIPPNTTSELRSSVVVHAASPRATRWPADRPVPQDWILLAKASRTAQMLPEANLALEAETFANYWAGKSGANATKLDWRKTWINWALRAKGIRDNGKGPTAHDKFFAGVTAAIGQVLGPPEARGDHDDVGEVGGPLLPPGLHARNG
jgi:uncharacterized protein YdaU (DUF1376 family)